MLRISVVNVMLPTLTTWGRPVRKSSIHLQRDVFSPRIHILVMSYEGNMVLTTAQSSINSILTYVFLLSRCEMAVWSAIEIASSVDLFGCYANWSGSRVSGIMVLM